jgi:hypothetical protein
MIKFVFIIILILVLLYLNQNIWIEMFSATYQTFQSYIPLNTFKYPMYPLVNSQDWFYRFFPTFNGYTNLPWWNTSLGNTTNMSYDLRGDPLVIPKTDFVWNNSSTIPIYNPPI